MTQRDEVAAVEPIADVLEALGVEFYVGGSVASSLHGVARATIDIDLVADLRPEHVDRFVARLEDSYYVASPQAVEAVCLKKSFNLIHLATMYKVDVFVMKSRPFDQAARRRTSLMTLAEDSPRTMAIASPEDTILNKLEWYRQGGEVSERQWTDVVGVLRVQSDRLDATYLRQWAVRLEIFDLLERAMAEAISPG